MKKRGGSQGNQELSKLMHKTKRAKKGAKKEIRADTAFIAAQKAKEIRERSGLENISLLVTFFFDWFLLR